MVNARRFIICFALLLGSCISGGIGGGTNTFIREKSNSTHNKKAILFLKESSLSSDSYQVMVCNNDYKLGAEDIGNAFTVDTNHDSIYLDNNSIDFTWLNNDSLQIDYDKGFRIFIQQQKIEGVSIVYKPR